MIEVRNILKLHSDFELNIPHLSIAKGECLGIIGHNGSGKSTFLKILLDLTTFKAGSIRINNEKNTGSKWKKYTGAFIDDVFLINYFTPYEYFKFIWNMRTDKSKDEFENTLDYYIKTFQLTQVKEKKIRNLSQGNKKKTGIISALFTNPELIILDEPFANLDTNIKNILHFELKTNNKNATIIFTTNNLETVSGLCTRIVILKNGKIKLNNTMKQLLSIANTNTLNNNNPIKDILSNLM